MPVWPRNALSLRHLLSGFEVLMASNANLRFRDPRDLRQLEDDLNQSLLALLSTLPRMCEE